MGEYENVSLETLYSELLKIRKELSMIEYAVIPIERLSQKELEEHKKDLEEALKSKRISFRELKR